jgi:F-type H+-transporting ATPase subunit b
MTVRHVMKEMRDAVENREDAVRMKEEYDEKLRNVDRTAEEILSDTKKKALQREDEIIAEARTEASRIIESARREAELEKKRVKDEVKQEMISVAALMSEKIIGESMDPEKQNALIEQTLDEIGDDTWLN